MKAVFRRSPSRMHLVVGSVIVLALLSLHGRSEGATATANLTVNATVAANCTIAGGSLDFGTYDPLVANKSTALQTTGTISVTCTLNAPANVYLGVGNNNLLTPVDKPDRAMAGTVGSSKLTYYLYSDSGRTTAWGGAATSGQAVIGTGVSQTLTVYGSVPANQNVASGSYSDTVVATVSF